MSCGVLIEGPAGVSLAARQTLLPGLFSSEPNNLFQRVMDSLPDGVCIANRELARFAFLEPISQVGNRRYLEQQLSQHLDQQLKSGARFGIILADLDKFKEVNDTYGHVAGDAALVAVARTLSHCLRASDVVGRWGGDEFMAIPPGVTREALARACEKFRRLVAQSTVRVDRSEMRVTVSVGAAIVAPGDTPETLLNRADQHLYTSKQAGRNRVSL